MPDGNAPIGHNAGPPFDQETVDQHTQRASEFLDAAGQWLDVGEIESEDQAARLNDFIAGVKKNKKATDEARKDAKRPHDEAGKAVQAAYSPILTKYDKAHERVQPLMTAWLSAQEAKRREEARQREEAARKEREEAERLAAQAASRHDVSGEADAEAAMKSAEKAQKEADRFAKGRANVQSATGGGRTASLRTYREVELVNARVAFTQYQDDPELLACLKKLAERDARAKGFDVSKGIPGFNITETQKAV